MVLDLYLIRHAEAAHNVGGATAGTIGGRSPEIPLTERGEEQAIALGRRLTDEGIDFDSLYSQPTVRGLETAERIARAVGVPVEEIIEREQLHELDQGDWVGRPKKEAYTDEVAAQINADNWNFSPPNGESQRQAADRIYNFIEQELIENLGDEDTRVGLVSSGTTMKSLIAKIMVEKMMRMSKAPIKNAIYTSVDNCSVSQFVYVPEVEGARHPGWHIVKLNDTAHLALPEGPGFKPARYFKYISED